MRRRLAGALATVAVTALCGTGSAGLRRAPHRPLARRARAARARPARPDWSSASWTAPGARAPARVRPGLGVLTLSGPQAADRRGCGATRRWRASRASGCGSCGACPTTPRSRPPRASTPWRPERRSSGRSPREGFPAAWDVTTGAAARGGRARHRHRRRPSRSWRARSRAPRASTAAIPARTPTATARTCPAWPARPPTTAAAWPAPGGAAASHVVKLGADVAGRSPTRTSCAASRLAIAHAPHAINMSFGGGPDSAALDAAIQAAYDRGIVLVAAASNNSEEDPPGRARLAAPAGRRRRTSTPAAAWWSRRRTSRTHAPAPAAGPGVARGVRLLRRDPRAAGADLDLSRPVHRRATCPRARRRCCPTALAATSAGRTPTPTWRAPRWRRRRWPRWPRSSAR